VTPDGVGQSGTVQQITLLHDNLSGKSLLANDFDSSSPGGAEDNQFHRASAAASSLAHSTHCPFG
jgi:hypothetical protein